MTCVCEQMFWSERWRICSWGTRSSPASLRRLSPSKTRWTSSGLRRETPRCLLFDTLFLCSSPVSPAAGTRLTAWVAWRPWWRRTSASWRIWAICAGRWVCWRRGTTSTCSAPVSWRRSSAEPTPSARSSTATRDRWRSAAYTAHDNTPSVRAELCFTKEQSTNIKMPEMPLHIAFLIITFDSVTKKVTKNLTFWPQNKKKYLFIFV